MKSAHEAQDPIETFDVLEKGNGKIELLRLVNLLSVT
jgi:hypothetical protein